jgi:hypothetical protein
LHTIIKRITQLIFLISAKAKQQKAKQSKKSAVNLHPSSSIPNLGMSTVPSAYAPAGHHKASHLALLFHPTHIQSLPLPLPNHEYDRQ